MVKLGLRCHNETESERERTWSTGPAPITKNSPSQVHFVGVTFLWRFRPVRHGTFCFKVPRWSNFYLLNSVKEWKRRYRSQIPALVPEIFKFKKCVKYANEMTYDVIHSAQYNIMRIGESLFTLFASLTYCYHYLKTLIKWKLWILKGHNSFSFLWKFEPNTSSRFRRNSLLKTRNFTGDVRLINFFATQQFRSFWWLIFPSILLAKSWKLLKLLNLISSFNFCIKLIYTVAASMG